MDNVEDFNGITLNVLPVDKVLCAALDAKIKPAIVVGCDEDGELYFASSEPNCGEVLWLLQKAIKELLND